MSKSSIVAILASVGLTLLGPMTSDAQAFARAILSGDDAQLLRFAQQNPDSVYKNDAIRLACETNWVNGNCAPPPKVRDLNNGGSNVAPPQRYGAV